MLQRLTENSCHDSMYEDFINIHTISCFNPTSDIPSVGVSRKKYGSLEAAKRPVCNGVNALAGSSLRFRQLVPAEDISILDSCISYLGIYACNTSWARHWYIYHALTPVGFASFFRQR